MKKKKQKIKETLEVANAAYGDRDKAFHQISEIKKMAQKEAKEYDNELKDLIEQSERPMRNSGLMGSQKGFKKLIDSEMQSKESEKEPQRPKSTKVR